MQTWRKHQKTMALSVLALGAILSVGTLSRAQTPPLDPNLKSRTLTRSMTAEVAPAASSAREPAATGSSSASDDPACQKVRKRLWIEGEGWIVRKVALCP